MTSRTQIVSYCADWTLESAEIMEELPLGWTESHGRQRWVVVHLQV
jgi:hypothetical protein